MRCIEMNKTGLPTPRFPRINRNMRCIEILFCLSIFGAASWLIETWDVLKYTKMWNTWWCQAGINRNMRCIEIGLANKVVDVLNKINRNMRCIEMIADAADHVDDLGLIETWDVLKFSFMFLSFLSRNWLIETWDVLKSPSSTDSVLKSPWLIETWDVLKCR